MNMIRTIAERWLTAPMNLLYPQVCGGCGRPLTEPGITVCWDCHSALHLLAPPFCFRCGEPVHGQVDHDYVCHVCSRRPPRYRQARAAIHYNESGKNLITRFKYSHALWLENWLAGLLTAALEARFADRTFDTICPVPLHPVKQRERGYNQSVLLASALSRRAGIPLTPGGALRRIRRTPSQTRLTAGQRMANVRGAFAVTRPAVFAGKRVLLVDDVMTTGATVGTCARVLLTHGAVSVDVLTVARGI